MKLEKRALQKRSYELKRNPTLEKKGDPVLGERLLKQAIAFREERKHDTDLKCEAAANEAAFDIHHALRGRVMSYGGFGRGKRLGAGRWRYENGQWIKRD